MAKVIAVSLILLAGCSMDTNDCSWAEPIRPVAGDDLSAVPGLARAVLTHNKTGAKNCGWKQG